MISCQITCNASAMVHGDDACIGTYASRATVIRGKGAYLVVLHDSTGNGGMEEN